MIDLAYNMALKSPSRFRLGAVIAKRKRVISTGFNQMRKTHPLMQKFSPDIVLGLHAEVHACVGVSAADLLYSEVWVCRILRNGDMALAKPCRVCENFLRDVGVRSVHFTTGNSVEILEL